MVVGSAELGGLGGQWTVAVLTAELDHEWTMLECGQQSAEA